MATSEYIRKTPGDDPRVTGWPSRKKQHRGIASPSVVTSMLMMLNDGLAILLAFGAALVLRAMLFDKANRLPGLPHDLISAPVSAVYLGWFILAYLLVANRDCIRRCRWPVERTRSG
jgi:hypothetical protein